MVILVCGLAVGCGSAERHAATGEVERRQARLDRGRYLVDGVLHCFACHSEVDWKAEGAQPVESTKGGGSVFPEELPFKVVAPNISPDRETGAGTWTDEQLARAIRDGIGHDGRVLFPIMPYMHFRALPDDDLASVIAYLRSIRPVRNTPGKTELPPPVKAALQAPPAAGSVPPPDLSTPAKRGAFLVGIANCSDCHTPIGPDMKPQAGMDFAGGYVLKGPWGEVAAANITPDSSGISYYTEALFVQAMRTGHVQARKLNDVMLWGYFRKMTDEDLKAIYAHLRALKPIQHRVDNAEPPTLCKRCGYRHGLGVDNKPAD